MYTTNCSWCQRKGIRGIEKNIFTPKEFYDFLCELITRVSISNGIPIGVSILIKDFIFDLPHLYIILEWIAFRGYRRWDPDRFNNIFTETICIDCHQHNTHCISKSIKPFNIVPGTGLFKNKYRYCENNDITELTRHHSIMDTLEHNKEYTDSDSADGKEFMWETSEED
jgi:hypothetical protein